MVFTDKLKRSVTLAVAALLFAASLIPLLNSQRAGAYGLLTSREIKMASSVAAATDVTYDVQVTTPTTSNIGGLVIDFCAQTPIIGDSNCTTPTGFNSNFAALALANQSGIVNWAVDTTNSDANTVILTRTAASFTAGTLSFDLGAAGGSDGITNPSTTNQTFYARILTYTTTAGAQAYTSGSPGAEPPLVHAGGVALSTANQITVTSKVQERLTFCVFTVDGTPANTCGTSTPVSGNSINLGDNNGVLSDTEAFVNKEPKFTISTNASSDAIVRARATSANASGTLASGATFSISGIGATAAGSTPGSEQFGFCVYQSTGSGLTLSAPYTHANCSATVDTSGNAPGSGGGDASSQFAFDSSTGGENLTTTYGDVIATKPAGSYSTATLPFIGNIATTTEPGIYTSTMTFIATGTY